MRKTKKRQTFGEGLIEVIRYLSWEPFKAFSKRITAFTKVEEKEKVALVLKSLGYHIDHAGCDEAEEDRALNQNLMEIRRSDKMRKKWAKWIDTGRWY